MFDVEPSSCTTCTGSGWILTDRPPSNLPGWLEVTACPCGIYPSDAEAAAAAAVALHRRTIAYWPSAVSDVNSWLISAPAPPTPAYVVDQHTYTATARRLLAAIFAHHERVATATTPTVVHPDRDVDLIPTDGDEARARLAVLLTMFTPQLVQLVGPHSSGFDAWVRIYMAGCDQLDKEGINPWH